MSIVYYICGRKRMSSHGPWIDAGIDASSIMLNLVEQLLLVQVSSPSQDWPDGGPRQYNDISSFTWPTICRVFDRFFGSIATTIVITLSTLNNTGSYTSVHPLDMPLCIRFDEQQ